MAEPIDQRGTNEKWASIRRRIYKRDGGVCQVCRNPVVFGKGYECGHIVERFLGGSDLDDNLVAMCWTCNHTKPPHDTRAEYEAWVAAGGEWQRIGRELKAEILAFMRQHAEARGADFTEPDDAELLMLMRSVLL